MSSQTAVAAEKPCHEKQKTNKVTKQNIQTKMGKKKTQENYACTYILCYYSVTKNTWDSVIH